MRRLPLELNGLVTRIAQHDCLLHHCALGDPAERYLLVRQRRDLGRHAEQLVRRRHQPSLDSRHGHGVWVLGPRVVSEAVDTDRVLSRHGLPDGAARVLDFARVKILLRLEGQEAPTQQSCGTTGDGPHRILQHHRLESEVVVAPRLERRDINLVLQVSFTHVEQLRGLYRRLVNRGPHGHRHDSVRAILWRHAAIEAAVRGRQRDALEAQPVLLALRHLEQDLELVAAVVITILVCVGEVDRHGLARAQDTCAGIDVEALQLVDNSILL
mmetsp:Transcript_23617/g.48908  ORF Transcript_23617/g.48908 Transcript_23617/m.48908 type:complete len:270 (+) Transcript_23617:218-1027(+)